MKNLIILALALALALVLYSQRARLGVRKVVDKVTATAITQGKKVIAEGKAITKEVKEEVKK